MAAMKQTTGLCFSTSDEGRRTEIILNRVGACLFNSSQIISQLKLTKASWLSMKIPAVFSFRISFISRSRLFPEMSSEQLGFPLLEEGMPSLMDVTAVYTF